MWKDKKKKDDDEYGAIESEMESDVLWCVLADKHDTMVYVHSGFWYTHLCMILVSAYILKTTRR